MCWFRRTLLPKLYSHLLHLNWKMSLLIINIKLGCFKGYSHVWVHVDISCISLGGIVSEAIITCVAFKLEYEFADNKY